MQVKYLSFIEEKLTRKSLRGVTCLAIKNTISANDSACEKMTTTGTCKTNGASVDLFSFFLCDLHFEIKRKVLHDIQRAIDNECNRGKDKCQLNAHQKEHEKRFRANQGCFCGHWVGGLLQWHKSFLNKFLSKKKFLEKFLGNINERK